MNSLTKSLKDYLKRFLTLARSRDLHASANGFTIAVVLLGIWLGLVIFIVTKHEFWRDEVRALSLARTAISPFDLYGLTQYDGHPILWYLLLFIGKSIGNTPLILPITSIIIAFSAVSVFMFISPFPFWIRCLFIFSSFPLYEYSVMARNYGISMLLLFVSAILYRNRGKHPFLLAFVLFLLANTNVHSTILVCLIAVIWAWDMVIDQRMASDNVHNFLRYLPFVIIFTGVLLCVIWTIPRENTIVTIAPVRNMSLPELADSLLKAALDAMLHPGQTFSKIVLGDSPLFVSVLLYLVVFGLINRPNLFLVALGSQVAFGVLFRVGYAGAYRHQGLFLVFMLFLYWLFIDSLNYRTMTRMKHLLFNIGFYGSMLILILVNINIGIHSILTDIYQEMSSSKSFGEFLNNSETYQDAIIVPEPDYLVESLPYYAINLIYLPRESRFSPTVSFTTEANYCISLGELLSTASTFKTRYNQPILIVLGHFSVGPSQDGKINFSFNKIFSWSSRELEDFNKATIFIAEFTDSISDENYRIYAIK
jgi:hypothetical protein